MHLVGPGLAVGDSRDLDSGGLVQLRQAAGLDSHNANGNCRASLTVRHYTETNDHLGGTAWWIERLDSGQVPSGTLGARLANRFVAMSTAAEHSGYELVVEEIHAILCKDPGSPVASLTPTLHADEYYGRRQSAIVSLVERGWCPTGGVRFLPDNTMKELWSRRPIHFTDTDEFEHYDAASGDVCIYDGMIGPDQRIHHELGVPHVSPDQPGQSSRLAVLMRLLHH